MPLRARKSDNYRYRDSWKSNNLCLFGTNFLQWRILGQICFIFSANLVKAKKGTVPLENRSHNLGHKFSYRLMDVKTERRSFFVRCRRTYVFKKKKKIEFCRIILVFRKQNCLVFHVLTIIAIWFNNYISSIYISL